MNAELKEQVRVAAYDANNVPAISPDERIRIYTSKEHVCHCIPITNRSLGLTVPILEDGKTVEYWFEKGIRDVDLVLKHNSSIGDEYVFDDNVFKVISPDQIKHRIYLKNPNIELTSDSFIYSIYDEQTDKKDIFKIGNVDDSIHLNFIYTSNNTEKNYFHFDKNQFKVDIDDEIILMYSDGIQNGIVSGIKIADDIIINYANGSNFSSIIVTEDIDIASHNMINIISNRVNIISPNESFGIASEIINSTADINIQTLGTGNINLILDNANSNNDILIKNIGHGEINIESQVNTNIDGQVNVNIQGGNNVTIYGTELLELKSTEKIDITCDNEVIINSPTILINPTTRFTVNGGSSPISIYRSSNHIRTQFTLDDLNNGYLMRENLYAVNNRVNSIVSVNDKQVLIRAYDDNIDHEYANPCHIELRTGDHTFHVATNKLEIGKLNANNILSYQRIPECIYPLMYDLKYTNKVSVANGGYWNGNTGQTDLRDVQRFTSIFTDSSFITDSYVEFAQVQAPLKTIFNINVNGKDNLNNPIKNRFTVLPDGILYSISNTNSNLCYIKFTVTGIEYTQGSTTLSKTWQQLLS